MIPYLCDYKDKKHRYVCCDIETTGLIENDGTYPERIHIIVAIDMITREEFVFDTQEKIHKEFPKFAESVDMWIGHNFLSYDLPVLNHLITDCNIDWRKVCDTLVLSRLFNPMIPKAGFDKKKNQPYIYMGLKRSEHSLGAWGQWVEYSKREHEDWSELNESMVERCRTDVILNIKVYEYLHNEGRDFSQLSIYLEHSTTWILFEQKMNGFQIDVPKAAQLLNTIENRRDELAEMIEKEACSIWRPKNVKTVRRVANGKVHAADINYLKKSKFKNLGDDKFLIYEEIPFKINSPKWVVQHMNRAGWQPYLFTPAGSPKLCEENLATLPDTAPHAYKLYAEWSMCNARATNIESWFEAMCKEGKVHGDVLSVGAKTHRMAHRNPNTANIAGVQSPYGAECRSCWTVEDPENYHLLGTDASGIQLRMLAHYIDDPEYTEGVLVDPHTTHQHILGLPTRAMAKTWIYAWLFGAGAARLGNIMGGSASDGKTAISMFEERVPGLKRLRSEREQAAKATRLRGLDGRYLPVPNLHGSLPAYLQGGEQSVMKLANDLWYNQAKKLGLDFQQSAVVHDEWQVRCHNNLIQDRTEPIYFKTKDEAEAYSPDKRVWSAPIKHEIIDKKTGEGYYKYVYHKLGELQVLAIREAGKRLKLNCPLDGEYNIGANWLDTH